MKITLYLSLLLIVCSIAGCNKNEDNEDLQELEHLATTYRIKTSTLTNTSSNYVTTTTYTYNSEGKVLKEDHQSYYLDYQYDGNYIVSLSSVNGDTMSEFYVANTGYADTVIFQGGDLMLRTYNTAGNLTKLVHQGGTVNYTWNNGNLATPGIDYLTDKFSTINYINKGFSYLGNESKNLPKTGYVSIAFGSIDYEFDNLQRVTKRSTGIFEETFTYY